jgi:hypothetical protein
VTCSIRDCQKKVYAKTWCKRHYESNLRHGDPAAVDNRASPKQAWVQANLSRESDECFSWPFGRNTNGYCRMNVGGRADYAHRVICGLKHGVPPSPMHRATHSCGNGHLGCLNHRHLRWATNSANQLERVSHGTDQRGEKHANAVATEQQAREVLRLSKTMSVSDAADVVGLSYGVAYHIVRGNSWQWLSRRYENVP